MTTERIVDPLVAPHAMEAARLLHTATRADRQVMQQPMDFAARPGAAITDPGTGTSRLLAYCEHIIEPEQWVTRLEMV